MQCYQIFFYELKLIKVNLIFQLEFHINDFYQQSYGKVIFSPLFLIVSFCWGRLVYKGFTEWFTRGLPIREFCMGICLQGGMASPGY